MDLYADIDLADGVFHHVAGVVDNRPGPPATTLALIYVDGAEAARQQLAAFGSLTSTDPILIGYGQESVGGNLVDAQYRGIADEVRISKIARSSFSPVIGESDDHYRRRLQVFQGWVLPNPDALEAALNQLAGPVAGDLHPFIVDETADPLVMGTLPLRELLHNPVDVQAFHDCPDHLQFHRDNFDAIPKAAVARRGLMVLDVDLRKKLPAIRQPVLMICGECDPIVPAACEGPLLEGLPHVARVGLPDCGHYPQYTHAPLVAEVVRQFLAAPGCRVGGA